MRNAQPAYVACGLRTLQRGLLVAALAGTLTAFTTLATFTVMLAGSGAATAAEPGSSVASSNSGATTTYRWVDAQGVVHYSDTPQPGAQKVEIAPAQTFQPGPTPTAQRGGEVGPRSSQYTCVITQPQAQQSIYAPETVPVSVQLSPELRSGDRVQVSFDGAAVSPADDSGLDFQIDMPIRGQHEVTAMVVDSNGRTVCTAPAVTFHVRRPSVLAPQSPTAHPAPPRPPLGR